MGFAAFNRPLKFNGVIYFPDYSPTAVQTSPNLAVDNLDVIGMLDSVVITQADIRAGLWDYATIELFRVNWVDLSQGQLDLRTGRLGEIKMGITAFIAELRGLMQAYQQTIGRLCMPACGNDVGDDRCGVNLVPFTITGTISGVNDSHTLIDSGRTEADGWFEGGKITWTSGLNIGLEMEVKSNTGTTIVLQLPMPFTVQVGDTYSMHAGCIKAFAVCGSKYSNQVRFGGFPHLPGVDAIVSGT
jgi:uncharacterized phage protein (TIGR02218 family)